MPAPPSNYLNKGPRGSVSAEAYGDYNKKSSSFTPPVYAKNKDTEQRLKVAISKSFLFSNLDDQGRELVIGAFRQHIKHLGDVVIRQGDDNARELFMLEKGTLHVYKKMNSSEPGDGKQVFEYNSAGDVFGELALLYNCPRSATIKASTDCVLWSIDRETFNFLVKDAASRKRNLYEGFLQSVEIFGSLNTFEIGQVADALQAKNFQRGQKIIKQGDVGNEFYILEDGKASAVKNGKVVKAYGPRDYFGELALIREQPRQADVIVDSATAKVLCIDRKCFRRLLGPLDQLLETRAAQYTKG